MSLSKEHLGSEYRLQKENMRNQPLILLTVSPNPRQNLHPLPLPRPRPLPLPLPIPPPLIPLLTQIPLHQTQMLSSTSTGQPTATLLPSKAKAPAVAATLLPSSPPSKAPSSSKTKPNSPTSTSANSKSSTAQARRAILAATEAICKTPTAMLSAMDLQMRPPILIPKLLLHLAKSMEETSRSPATKAACFPTAQLWQQWWPAVRSQWLCLQGTHTGSPTPAES